PLSLRAHAVRLKPYLIRTLMRHALTGCGCAVTWYEPRCACTHTVRLRRNLVRTPMRMLFCGTAEGVAGYEPCTGSYQSTASAVPMGAVNLNGFSRWGFMFEAAYSSSTLAVLRRRAFRSWRSFSVFSFCRFLISSAFTSANFFWPAATCLFRRTIV